MREFIFTFKRLLFSTGFLLLLLGSPAWADSKRDRSLPPEEDDFSPTPFTEYGSFNQDADEDAETRFMQYGRLFGVSVGVGDEGVTGNRGQLWQGGFPLFELKVHYWFDFHLALDLGVSLGTHSYQSSES